MNRFVAAAWVACLCLGLSLGGPAAAQSRRLDASPFVPGFGLADPGLYAGWLINPAAVGLLPTAQLALFGTDAVMGGSVGLSLAALKLQFGIDGLRDLGGGDGVDGLDGLRTGLGVALSDGRMVSLGFLWQKAFRLDSLPSTDLLSAGLLYRPVRWVSLALAAHNLSEQPFDPAGPSAKPRLDLSAGFAVRPGTERLSIGVDVHTDRSGNYVDPSASLAWRVIDGLEVGAGGWLNRRDDDWCWGAGGTLSLALGTVGVMGGGGAGSGAPSWHYGARIASPGESTAFAPRHRFVRIVVPRVIAEDKRHPLFGEASETLVEFRMRLHRLALDPEVDGLLLVFDSTGLGWSQSQEVARSIDEISRMGKSIVAYLISGGNRDYYIASRADFIVVNPATVVSLTGIAGSLTFYRNLLQAVGVEPQFVRIGKYKSFPEQFDREAPSPESLEQTEALLDDFYTQLVGDIARNRNVETARVKEWIDQGPLTAGKARELGAVQLVADYTDMRTVLEQLGFQSPVLVDGYPFRPVRNDSWGPRPRIAVVSIVGSIVDGQSSIVPLVNMKLAGSATLVPTLDALARDRAIDGVLIRIESPGGAALASELINRALRKLAGKHPVVVSIAGTAASGGYYIAAGADRILAMPGSVTGSIGIWFGKFSISGLLDKLKINRVPTERGKHASIFSLDRRLTEEELAALSARLSEGYDLFLTRILETRKLSREQLEAIAQGRVWSGRRALDNGLVDAEGGCLEALQELKTRMGIDPEREVDLVFHPAPSLSVRMAQALGAARLAGASAPFVGDAGASDLEALDLGAVLELLGTPRSWALNPDVPSMTGL